MQLPSFSNLVLIACCTNGQNCNWVGELWAASYFNRWNINIIYWKHFHRPQKANVSQERDSFRRGQGRHASRLACSQVSQAQSQACRVLCLAVPCPSPCVSPITACCSCSGLDLLCCSAGTRSQRGQGPWCCHQPEDPPGGAAYGGMHGGRCPAGD